jgi:CRP-like cAMP-binding protein
MSADPLFARFGREFPAGEVLFREGDAGAVMYVLQAGRVRIAREFASGERTLALLGPGDFFGEMAIVNGKPRTATATAVEPVRALVIDAKTFEAMVIGNGEIALRLITRLARRLDSANAFIEILLQHDPRLRVILGLARAADEQGQRGDDGVRVLMSVNDLAQAVGLDPAVVTEVIKRLLRVKVIQALAPEEGEGWRVPDVEKLQEFLEVLERDRAHRPSSTHTAAVGGA